MQTEYIDRSAFELAAAALGPCSTLDRRYMMPVAGFVFVTDLGEVILRGSGVPTVLPVGHELPLADEPNAIMDGLTDSMDEYRRSLRAAGYAIQNISGLIASPNGLNAWFCAGTSPDGRTIALLPFLSTVRGEQSPARPKGMLLECWEVAQMRVEADPEPWRSVGARVLDLARTKSLIDQPARPIYKQRVPGHTFTLR